MKDSKSPRNLSSRVAKHIYSLPKSGIRDFFELVNTMDDVISLGIGEPDFVTPWTIREGSIYSLERGRTSYTSNLGLLSLRKAICKYVAENYKVEYDPVHECIVTVGVSEALDLVIRAITDPGDEIIYNEPCYVSYYSEIKMAHGVPVPVATYEKNNFALDPADLEKAITPKTKAILLNFPCNPTGAVMPVDKLRKVAEIAIEHDLVVITDEIYSELLYEGEHVSIASLPGMRERTLFLHGFSKAFAMTGWRIGFIAAPEWIVKGVNKLQGQYTSGPSSVSQKAAEAAYTGTQAPVEEMRKAFERRRNLIVKLAKEVPGFEVNVPEGAFYLFPKCDSYFGKKDGDRVINNAEDLAMYLLEVGHVACVGGTSFGAPECIRMSYATSDENISEAIRRIKETLARLK